jgi:glycosyltransferase involved in cell wall biosynthesis
VSIFAQDAPGDYEETEPYVFRYPAINIPKFNYSLTMPYSNFVNKLLPSLKLHLIHSNHPLLLGNAAADQAEKLDIPLVFTFHTSYVEYADGYAQYVPFSQAFIEEIVVDGLAKYLNRCHHIITPSDSIKEALAHFAGLTDRVTTIPTGIDLEPYQNTDGRLVREQYGWEKEIVLVSVGRLAEEKNFDTLLDAVAQVMSKQDDVRLMLIGDGPRRGELERHAQKLGVADKVKFTGRIPFEGIPGHLKAANLFVFASITETQGLVTMEAMATGLPVVAVAATGTSDAVVNGQEGLLTENNSEALAQAIQQVLADKEMFARFKMAAVEKAKSFDMMVQAQKVVDVYRQAIEDKKAGLKIRVDIDILKARIKKDRDVEE